MVRAMVMEAVAVVQDGLELHARLQTVLVLLTAQDMDLASLEIPQTLANVRALGLATIALLALV
jgi:hypothetical protein